MKFHRCIFKIWPRLPCNQLDFTCIFHFFFRSISPARWTSHTSNWTFPRPHPWTIPPQSPIPNPLSIRSSAKSTGTMYQFPRQSTVRCGLRLFIWASWRARALLFKWVFVLLLFYKSFSVFWNYAFSMNMFCCGVLVWSWLFLTVLFCYVDVI